jgi:hypothetical protein
MSHLCLTLNFLGDGTGELKPNARKGKRHSRNVNALKKEYTHAITHALAIDNDITTPPHIFAIGKHRLSGEAEFALIRRKIRGIALQYVSCKVGRPRGKATFDKGHRIGLTQRKRRVAA